MQTTDLNPQVKPKLTLHLNEILSVLQQPPITLLPIQADPRSTYSYALHPRPSSPQPSSSL